MTFISNVKKDIESELENLIKSKTDALLVEAAERSGDQSLIDEVEYLRPKKPEPSEEDRQQAASLQKESDKLKTEVFNRLQGDIFPLIDQIIAVNNREAELLYGLSGFVLSSFLNEIKTALSSYYNQIVLQRRQIPPYAKK